MTKSYNYQKHSIIAHAMYTYNNTMPGDKFTSTDYDILCLVRSFHKSEHKLYMSYETLAKELLVSKSPVKRSINRLIDAGFIEKHTTSKRSKYLTYNENAVKKFIYDMQQIDA